MRLRHNHQRFDSGNVRLNQAQQQKVARRKQRMLLSHQRRQERLDRYRRAFPRWLPLSWVTETMLVQMVVSWFKGNYDRLCKATSIQNDSRVDEKRFQLAVETLEEKVMLSADFQWSGAANDDWANACRIGRRVPSGSKDE